MPLNGRKVNLFIVGAPKCGTTSLHYYLSQHPEIFMSPVKEPHFFCEIKSNNKGLFLTPKKNISYITKIIKDINIYNSLFDKVSNEKIIGEASPLYLWSKDSAKRIFHYNPFAQIIILLREPVERAFSHYLMEVGSGYETGKTFVDAMTNDLTKNSEIFIFGESPPYIQLGLYHEQLKRYFEYFPAHQIKIVLTKDFLFNTKETVKDIFSFINVDSSLINKIDIEKRNETLMPRNKVVKILLRIYNSIFISKYINNIIDFKDKVLIKKFFFSNKGSIQKLNENDILVVGKYFEENNKKLYSDYNIKF